MIEGVVFIFMQFWSIVSETQTLAQTHKQWEYFLKSSSMRCLQQDLKGTEWNTNVKTLNMYQNALLRKLKVHVFFWFWEGRKVCGRKHKEILGRFNYNLANFQKVVVNAEPTTCQGHKNALVTPEESLFL